MTWSENCARSYVRSKDEHQQISGNLNLVPRAHVPFGQHQDTELWNNQQARSQSPRVFCFLKFDTAVFSKPNFDFPSFSSAY